jgi:hypothetical protein
MQAILFIGADYYPRKHLQDMVTVFSTVPTDAEIARACQVRMEEAARPGSPIGEPDWATILVVDGVSTPVVHGWQIEHEPSLAQLEQAGYTHCWQSDDKYWHGVKKADLPA